MKYLLLQLKKPLLYAEGKQQLVPANDIDVLSTGSGRVSTDLQIVQMFFTSDSIDHSLLVKGGR